MRPSHGTVAINFCPDTKGKKVTAEKSKENGKEGGGKNAGYTAMQTKQVRIREISSSYI